MLTNTYGCPLHSKTDYAKADWTVWTAALQNDRLMFREFILPLYNYMNENKWRVPMADTYNVVNYSQNYLTIVYCYISTI